MTDGSTESEGSEKFDFRSEDSQSNDTGSPAVNCCFLKCPHLRIKKETVNLGYCENVILFKMGFIKSLGNSALVVKHKSPDKNPVLCGQDQSINDAKLHILTFLRSLISEEIDLLSEMTDDAKKSIMSNKIISFLEGKFQNDVMAFENNKGHIVVHATETSDLKKASKYLHDNFHKQFVKMDDVHKFNYIETYLKQEIYGLADVGDCTSIFKRNTSCGHEYVVLGFGNKSGFNDLTKKLKLIIKGILSIRITLQMPKVSEYADVVCKGIEKKWNVLIDADNSVGISNVANIGGVTLTLINDRIEDQKKAGPELQDECSTKGPLDVGQVVETWGYNLPCSMVFHCLGKEYDEANPKESQETVMKLVSTCLDMANIQNLTSIAFPPLACGVLKMPPQLSAECILDSIENYAWSDQHSLKNVIIAIYNSEIVFQAYQQVLNAKLDNSHSAWKNTKGIQVSIVGSSEDSLFNAHQFLSEACLI